MAIRTVQAFLIYPGKVSTSPKAISSKDIAQTGPLFNMLSGIFGATPDVRDFEVTFVPNAAGQQQNDCRDLMLNYQTASTLANGERIAQRLQSFTDNRSGIGLLFLMVGTHGGQERLVVSRFPTDKAILAQIENGGLEVEFLEQVFIKRLSAYKALMLEAQNPSSGFWSGIATDRQAGGSAENISDYWIKDFLAADFSETPAAGTKRLAQALRAAVKATPNIQVKGEIAAAASLAKSVFHGQKTSIEDFCKHFGLSNSAQQTIQNSLSKPSLFHKNFLFDSSEFKKVAPYRTVELNSGAILTAPSDEFASVFATQDMGNGEVEYSTVGRVSDQRLASK